MRRKMAKCGKQQIRPLPDILRFNGMSQIDELGLRADGQHDAFHRPHIGIGKSKIS